MALKIAFCAHLLCQLLHISWESINKHLKRKHRHHTRAEFLHSTLGQGSAYFCNLSIAEVISRSHLWRVPSKLILLASLQCYYSALSPSSSLLHSSFTGFAYIWWLISLRTYNFLIPSYFQGFLAGAGSEVLWKETEMSKAALPCTGCHTHQKGGMCPTPLQGQR